MAARRVTASRVEDTRRSEQWDGEPQSRLCTLCRSNHTIEILNVATFKVFAEARAGKGVTIIDRLRSIAVRHLANSDVRRNTESSKREISPEMIRPVFDFVFRMNPAGGVYLGEVAVGSVEPEVAVT